MRGFRELSGGSRIDGPSKFSDSPGALNAIADEVMMMGEKE